MSVAPRPPLPMDSGAGGSAGSGASRPSRLPAWLLTGKVRAPEPAAWYARREALLQRLAGYMERRLTVLRAPAGFGKTTALTAIAREAREQGRLVAWLSLDDDDAPDVFGTYLARAFEYAGLELPLPAVRDAWSTSPAAQQIGMLARAVELHAAPCLLVLDEIDRAPPATIALLDRLLGNIPANFHVALACRSDQGLDLATRQIDGEALIAGVDELRFSSSEVAAFFGGELSRRALAELEERTAGWPIALVAQRDPRAAEAAGIGADAPMIARNYIDVRLLRGLSAEDRGFLLDLSVFDRIEASLVDDVLESSNARVRVMGLPALDGLLLPACAGGGVLRLHPLVRQHCRALLEREDLHRKCSLHERLARALVRRGDLNEAWRHAAAAGDRRLVADLMERFGVFQLWLRGGMGQLIVAGRYLTPAITAPYPRLELLRCVLLRVESHQREARALLASVAARTAGHVRDRKGGDDVALAADSIFAQAVLAGSAAAPMAGGRELLPTDSYSTSADAAVRPIVAAARHTWLCAARHERADFEASARHGRRARHFFSDDMRFGPVFVDTYLGMSAMARGHVSVATIAYSRARQGIRERFPDDPHLTTSIDVLKMELDLERGRLPASPRRALLGVSQLRDVWTEVYVAALGVASELTSLHGDCDAATARLTAVLDYVHAMHVEGLACDTAALLAHYLVEAGHPGEAAQVWSAEELPTDLDELVDLECRSWRATEALACARARLLAAQGEHAAAAELADRLSAAAAGRGLTRTRMRALALAVALAEDAGQPDRAVARLIDYLRLVAKVDYVRPLVRHRDAARKALRRLRTADVEDAVTAAAASMEPRVAAPPINAGAVFTPREVQVLREVQQGHRNAAVGSRLGMTLDGVRYHLKNIYRKTGASGRAEAVRMALSLGLLS